MTDKEKMLRVARRRKTARLYLEGHSQREIADRLRVSVATVGGDLAKIRKQWLDSTLIDFDEAKAKEIAKIDAVEAELWEAWRRSCKPNRVTEITEKASVLVHKKSRTTVNEPFERNQKTVLRDQSGDPRFMDGILKCVEMRLRLLGALKDPTGGRGVSVTVVNWGDMSHKADYVDPLEQKIKAVQSTSTGNAQQNGIGRLEAQNEPGSTDVQHVDEGNVLVGELLLNGLDLGDDEATKTPVVIGEQQSRQPHLTPQEQAIRDRLRQMSLVGLTDGNDRPKPTK